MLQTYLVNILIFCAILLLLVFVVAMVQIVIVLIDIRKTTKTITEKIQVVSSLFDIVTMLTGAFDLAHGRLKNNLPGKSTISALVAGIKKGLEVFLKK